MHSGRSWQRAPFARWRAAALAFLCTGVFYGCPRGFASPASHSDSRTGLASFASASGLAQAGKPASGIVSMKPAALFSAQADFINHALDGQVRVLLESFPNRSIRLIHSTQSRKGAATHHPIPLVVVVRRHALQHLQRVLIPAGHKIGRGEEVGRPHRVVRVEPHYLVDHLSAAFGFTEACRIAGIECQDFGRTGSKTKGRVQLSLGAGVVALVG